MKGGGINGLRSLVAMVAMAGMGDTLRAARNQELLPDAIRLPTTGEGSLGGRHKHRGTVAQDRRRAKKARNVARNRAAHRGCK